MRKSKMTFFIIVALAIVMSFVALNGLILPLGRSYELILPGAPDMRFGIDIRGGVDAMFKPADDNIVPTERELDSARSIIETRLDNQNILDREVTVDRNNGYIIVRFPWKADETDFNPEDAIAELGETAMLTFKDEDGNVIIEGSRVEQSEPARDPMQGWVVLLELDDEGAEKFSEATKNMIGKPINIYMDDTLIQSAIVNSHITNGEAMITGMASAEDAKALADKINAGALPYSMVTTNHSSISPFLGSGSLDVMVLAGGIAFVVICIFLILYYRLPGFVACISLIIQIAGQLLALSIPQVTLTLTGIAGVILSIGMGVDANVIISERISEEIKAGKTLKHSISLGFTNAFSSVFDGNITVLIVGVVLLAFGSGSVLSFAYTLLTGIFFNFVAGVTASRLMIRSLSNYKVFSNPKLYTCLSRRVTL